MRRRPRNVPLLLLASGLLLLAGSITALIVLPQGGRVAEQTTSTPAASTTTAPAPPTTTAPPPPPPTTTAQPTTTAPPPTTPPTTTAPTPVPAPVAMSWQSAGGLVWHADAIDPTLLGQEMRAAGFGWVAVQLADGSTRTQLPPSWVQRFRAASGLPVGGWSVLRDDPAGEAQLAARLVSRLGLDFYVADAEREYERTNGPDVSAARFARSAQFVAAFRAAEPSLPAAVSSYCRADRHDIDWHAWAGAGFAFLPQAYVSQLGQAGDPAVCARGAAGFFPASVVHPTIDAFSGAFATPAPDAYAQLLRQAGTTGFSIYPAEATAIRWDAYGAALQVLHLAVPAPPAS